MSTKHMSWNEVDEYISRRISINIYDICMMWDYYVRNMSPKEIAYKYDVSRHYVKNIVCKIYYKSPTKNFTLIADHIRSVIEREAKKICKDLNR